MRFFIDKIFELFKNRIFVFFIIILSAFIFVSSKLYTLQIVEGAQINESFNLSISQTLDIPASRGNIYDRYGKPLAINEVAFSVNIDNSVTAKPYNKNELISKLVKSLGDMGLAVTDTLPISEDSKEFLLSGEELNNWKTSIGLSKKQMDMTPIEVLDYLCEKYGVSKEKDSLEIRRELSLATEISDKNLVMLYLVVILTENKEIINDEIPISESLPYTYNEYESESARRLFLTDIGVDKEKNLTAQEAISYMEEKFDIPKSLSPIIKRRLLSVNFLLYQNRYRKYKPATIALNVSDDTVAKIEEHQISLPSVTIGTNSLRIYPTGKYMSHILGYVRKISDNEYEEYKSFGYTNSDIVGKSGIEKVYELDLNGVDGEKKVEVDVSGKIIKTVETKQPVSGKDIYLTIDSELQKKAYDYLEDELTKVLVGKLTATDIDDDPISLKQFFISMVETGSIDITSILNSVEGEELNIKNIIYEISPSLKIETDEDKKIAKDILIGAIESGRVSQKSLTILLCEQDKITYTEDYLTKIKLGQILPITVILNKLNERELTPADTNLDPSSGSLVINDVNTGEYLAIVTYPSYDNNEFVNNFNNDYYKKLLEHPNTPLVNRPLSQKKAPGSTFKMITAAAALESGAISPTTLIKDEGLYKNTGVPYPRCWKYSYGYGTHGLLDVSHALEVSCNYFFYEAAYRMGNVEAGTSKNSIETLNKYMKAFGLDDPTGIEIGEAKANMATPEYKEYITKWQNPEATEYQTRWTDGETIRAAIGQSVNNYTSAQINKYIATLANGGTRYKAHVVSKILNHDGTTYNETKEIVESTVELKASTIEAIYKGMYLVTTGEAGTLKDVFKDYPVKVAAKSGTAEEGKNRSSHVWFAGFAPYEDPQIAVTSLIPFGDSKNSPAANLAKNIISYYMGMETNGEGESLSTALTE